MSEFQDRENPGIGSLPEDIMAERYNTGTDPGIPEAPPAGLITGQRSIATPPDIESQGERLQHEGVIGSPTITASVTSIFKTRPINARDFLATGQSTLKGGDRVDKTSTASFSYTVPSGFVGVWQGFAFNPSSFVAYSLTNSVNGTELNAVSVSLLIDDFIIPDYENMLLGQSVDMFDLPTHVIGREGQRFTLQVNYTDAHVLLMYPFDPTPDINVALRIYGTNLQTRGLPKAFEIMSQYFAGSNK